MSKAMEQGALSGSFVMRHREVLRERLGADAFAKVIGTLQPAAREAILGARAESWVPVGDIDALFTQAARAIGRDPADLHAEVSTQVAATVFRTVWRILLGFSSDSMLAARAPVFYGKSWNRGTLTVNLLGPGRAEAVLQGWPDAPDFTLRAVRISLGVVLKLAGRQEVQVVVERRAHGARWHMSWHS